MFRKNAIVQKRPENVDVGRFVNKRTAWSKLFVIVAPRTGQNEPMASYARNSSQKQRFLCPPRPVQTTKQ